MASSRRFLAGVFRFGLVVFAIVLVSGYVRRKFSHETRHVSVQREAPPPDAVDLTLTGDKILAGLSPKTVAQVKGEIAKSTTSDTTGFAGSITQIVKQSVAGAIGTHAVFPLADIKDIRYEGDQIVVDWTDGGKHELFGNASVNGRKTSKSFRREDAMKFVQAVRARKGLPQS
jgi:hypothetical protein